MINMAEEFTNILLFLGIVAIVVVVLMLPKKS